MSIHKQIRQAREKMGWSMERLAKEVSEAEGLAKPLAWQTVQQWENGTSAPKRTRMEVVQRLLKIGNEPAPSPRTAEPDAAALAYRYHDLLIDLEDIPEVKRSRLMDMIHQAAEESREAAAHFAKKEPVTAATRRGGPTKSSTSMTYGDGNRRQRSLPLTPVADPFTAEPGERESALYRRIERAPKEPHGGAEEEKP